MRIKKIEHNTSVENVLVINSKETNLYPVILTVKSWFKTKKVKAYPTSTGPTYGNNFIHFFYYIDEDGKKLSANDSERINMWCAVKQFQSN